MTSTVSQSDMNSSFKWQLVQEETDPAVLFSLLLLFFQGLKANKHANKHHCCYQSVVCCRQEPFLTPRTDLVALVANPSMDVLPRVRCTATSFCALYWLLSPQGKSLTLQCVLDALKDVSLLPGLHACLLTCPLPPSLYRYSLETPSVSKVTL